MIPHLRIYKSHKFVYMGSDNSSTLRVVNTCGELHSRTSSFLAKSFHVPVHNNTVHYVYSIIPGEIATRSYRFWALSWSGVEKQSIVRSGFEIKWDATVDTGRHQSPSITHLERWVLFELDANSYLEGQEQSRITIVVLISAVLGLRIFPLMVILLEHSWVLFSEYNDIEMYQYIWIMKVWGAVSLTTT